MRLTPHYQPGERIGGRYQVHKALMGGMGEVYLCLDLEEMIPLALKTFQQRYLAGSQRLRRAFEQEVATWVALEQHPNIVRCFMMDTFDRKPFMILEWVAGEEGKGSDLRSWLRHGPLDLKLALQIAIDICDGLIYARSKQPGLVHRDLKPENILMAQGGLAKITDFGLVQIMQTAGVEPGQSSTADSRHSLVGQQGIAGTPAYMAPEQWRGEPLDERTDIYALGCILYELLTGRCPFTVDFTPSTPQQMERWLQSLQAAHATAPYPKPPTPLPPLLDELLQCCLAKEYTARPAGWADLLTQLTNVYFEHVGTKPPARRQPGFITVDDYVNRCHTYTLLGRYEDALHDVNSAFGMDPNHTVAYRNRGAIYLRTGRFQEAIEDLDHALERDTIDVVAYTNRSSVYQKLGETEKALQDLNLALQLDPTYILAYLNRSFIHQEFYRYEEALRDLNHTLSLDPNNIQARINRSFIYQERKQFDAALLDLNYILDLDPDYFLAYTNLGVIYQELGQYDKALQSLNHSLLIDSDQTLTYTIRSFVYQEIGQFKQALTDLNCILTLDPNAVLDFAMRGSIYLELGQYEDALIDLDRAIELDPAHIVAYTTRAQVLEKYSRYEDALVDLNHAIQINPNAAWAYSKRALIYQELGQSEKAQADLNRASVLGTSKRTALNEVLPAFRRAAQFIPAKVIATTTPAQRLMRMELPSTDLAVSGEPMSDSLALPHLLHLQSIGQSFARTLINEKLISVLTLSQLKLH